MAAALAALGGASCAHLTVVPVPIPPMPTVRAPRPAVGDFPPIRNVPSIAIFPQVILRSSSLLVAEESGGNGYYHEAGKIFSNDLETLSSTSRSLLASTILHHSRTAL
jgi:hypothetical protein